MTTEDAVKMIQDEQDRLIVRREEVSAAVARQNGEAERINAEKLKFMEEFGKFDSEETPKIAKMNNDRTAMVQELNGMQDTLKKMQEEGGDPAEMKKIHENLTAKHKTYTEHDKVFQVAHAEYTATREVFQSRMAIVSRQEASLNELNKVVQVQIDEVNEQVKNLQEKQNNFKDTASYMQSVSNDLKKMGADI